MSAEEQGQKLLLDKIYPFGAQDERFFLRFDELRQLEEAFDHGPFVLYRSLAEGTCRANLIRETLRLGLIGGGKTPAEALRLVRNNHDGFPLETNLALAAEIFAATLFGRRMSFEEAEKATADYLSKSPEELCAESEARARERLRRAAATDDAAPAPDAP